MLRCWIEWEVPTSLEWEVPTSLEWEVPTSLEWEVPTLLEWEVPTSLEWEVPTSLEWPGSAYITRGLAHSLLLTRHQLTYARSAGQQTPKIAQKSVPDPLSIVRGWGRLP